MKGYEDTIQTEFDWIGDIPSEWSVPRLKHLTACLDGKRIPLNGEERSKMQGDVPYWGANAIMDYVSDCLFDEPLLLVGEDGAPFTIKGRDVAFESHGKVWPNNHIHVLRPNDNSLLRFLTYSMNATDYANFVEGSTRQKLTQSALMNIPIALPPKREATQIFKFLDYETAKIDALIDEQKRLIELLKEKRQAVISHAVTKGLNPDAPMKDSGVDWLGEVPQHWKVTKLKNYCNALPGFAFSSSDFSPEFTEHKLLRGVNVGVGSIRWNDTVYLNSSVTQKMRTYQLSEGDIVIGLDRPWIGDGLRISQITKADLPAFLVQRVASLKPTQNLMRDYLYLTLNSNTFKGYIEPELTGVSVPHLSTDQVLNYTIAIPPKDEQSSLCKQVKSILRSTDNLIRNSAELERVLKERRSALISAAVTGKIDVRDWQPPAGSDTVDSNAAVQTESHYG